MSFVITKEMDRKSSVNYHSDDSQMWEETERPATGSGAGFTEVGDYSNPPQSDGMMPCDLEDSL